MSELASRRDFLESLAGFGASIIFPSGKTLGQSSAPRSGRIDVHHHFGSPAWLSMVNTKKTQGYPTWQPYTPARAIEDMDRGGVSTALQKVGLTGEELRGVDRENALRMLPKYRA